MAARLIIDGDDGTLEVKRTGDMITFTASEGDLFKLDVSIKPEDARALSSLLEEISFTAFDMLEVGEEEDFS